MYFCPGFKSGVKHLFNIISRKKEALKDEANQKDKVQNKRIENNIKSKFMEIHLLRNKKSNRSTGFRWRMTKIISQLTNYN